MNNAKKIVAILLLLGIWIIKTIFGLSIPVKLPQASKILKKNEDGDE